MAAVLAAARCVGRMVATTTAWSRAVARVAAAASTSSTRAAPAAPPPASAPSAAGYRSHTCGEVGTQLAGKSVSLVGWVAAQRDLGGIRFLVLRDAYGAVQVTMGVHEAAAAGGMRLESVVRVTGTVAARPPALVNPAMASGGVEVVATHVALIAAAPIEGLPVQIGVTGALAPAPPPASGGGAGSAAAGAGAAPPDAEENRLTYRYLDLRRPVLQRNLRLRSAVTHAMREALHTASPPFVEVRLVVSV